jgi:anti-sigma regulatory factor (Ser/Thr protein kinase)
MAGIQDPARQLAPGLREVPGTAEPTVAMPAGVVPHQVPSVAWWTRSFPGGADQVGEARGWVGDLLPDCDPLADLLLLACELCTNAVVHTRSGHANGWFSVAVEWTPVLARVVVGDQGSATVPAATVQARDATWADESGRGLWLVDEVADGWGTASRPGARWVWADVLWQANGGAALQVPGGADALADIALVRRAFPGAAIWWGHQTRSWQAALPGASGLLSAATRGGLARVLAGVYPQWPLACGRPVAVGPEAGVAGTADELQARQPGGGLPRPVRDAAVRAGRSRRPVDPAVLQRVRDTLARVPAGALGRHHVTIPGDCLAFPHEPREAR